MAELLIPDDALVLDGPSIRRAREAAGLGVAAVAAAMGKSFDTVRGWELRDARCPTVADLGKLASLYDCDVSAFFRSDHDAH